MEFCVYSKIQGAIVAHVSKAAFSFVRKWDFMDDEL